MLLRPIGVVLLGEVRRAALGEDDGLSDPVLLLGDVALLPVFVVRDAAVVLAVMRRPVGDLREGSDAGILQALLDLGRDAFDPAEVVVLRTRRCPGFSRTLSKGQGRERCGNRRRTWNRRLCVLRHGCLSPNSVMATQRDRPYCASFPQFCQFYSTGNYILL